MGPMGFFIGFPKVIGGGPWAQWALEVAWGIPRVIGGGPQEPTWAHGRPEGDLGVHGRPERGLRGPRAPGRRRPLRHAAPNRITPNPRIFVPCVPFGAFGAFPAIFPLKWGAVERAQKWPFLY